MKSWYRIQASPVAHFFPHGLDASAACGVLCTRKEPWKPFKSVGGEPCRGCLDAQDQMRKAAS